MRGLINVFLVLTISITFWAGQSEANDGGYGYGSFVSPYFGGYYGGGFGYRYTSPFRRRGYRTIQPQFFRADDYFKWEKFPQFDPNKRVEKKKLDFNSKLSDKDNQAAIGQWTILLDKYDRIDDPKKKEALKKQMAVDLVNGKLSPMPALAVQSIAKKIEEAKLDLPYQARRELENKMTKKVQDSFKGQSFCLGDEEKFKKQMAMALMEAADKIETDYAIYLNLDAGLSGLAVKPPIPENASDKLKKAYRSASLWFVSMIFESTAVRSQYACQMRPSDIAEFEEEYDKKTAAEMDELGKAIDSAIKRLMESTRSKKYEFHNYRYQSSKKPKPIRPLSNTH